MSAQFLSLSPEHYTPGEFVEAARYVLGRIDLDPASCELANRTVRADRFYSAEENGLIRSWRGNVFVNPPGDKTGRLVQSFWKRAYQHAKYGAVIWVGFSLSQLQTLQRCGCEVPTAFPHVIVRKRIKWIAPERENNHPTHGNYFCLLGGDVVMRTRFKERFGEFGAYAPGKRQRRGRDIESEILCVLHEHGSLPSKAAIARMVKARKAAVIEAIDSLIASNLLTRRNGEFTVP